MRRSRRVVPALVAGLIGALAGALGAYKEGAAVQTIMAAVGFAFGTAIGVVLIVLVRLIRPPTDPVVVAQGDLRSGDLPAPEEKDPFDGYYPGNPDPQSRQVTGWRLPSERS